MTRKLRVSYVGAASALVLLATLPLRAQQVDTPSIEKIKDEGMNRSQVMEIVSYLTDVYGPRSDRLTQHQEGWRMGGHDDEGMGADERLARAVDAVSSADAADGMRRGRRAGAGGSTDEAVGPAPASSRAAGPTRSSTMQAVAPQQFSIPGTPSGGLPDTGPVRGDVVMVTETTEAEPDAVQGTAPAASSS